MAQHSHIQKTLAGGSQDDQKTVHIIMLCIMLHLDAILEDPRALELDVLTDRFALITWFVLNVLIGC